MLDTNMCIYLMKNQPQQVAARFAQEERKRDQLDKLIAAHAIGLGIPLVTNNERDFQAYPGLKVENWLND